MTECLLWYRYARLSDLFLDVIKLIVSSGTAGCVDQGPQRRLDIHNLSDEEHSKQTEYFALVRAVTCACDDDG